MMRVMVLNQLIGLLFLATTLVSPLQIDRRSPLDPGPKPICVTPDSTVISSGSMNVQITMDQTVGSNTTVTLTSSHPSVLAVPASVVVQNGNSTASFVAATSRQRASNQSTVVTITASTVDGSAYEEVTVND